MPSTPTSSRLPSRAGPTRIVKLSSSRHCAIALRTACNASSSATPCFRAVSAIRTTTRYLVTRIVSRNLVTTSAWSAEDRLKLATQLHELLAAGAATELAAQRSHTPSRPAGTKSNTSHAADPHTHADSGCGGQRRQPSRQLSDVDTALLLKSAAPRSAARTSSSRYPPGARSVERRCSVCRRRALTPDAG